jgi:hypothetical protein
MTFSFTLYEQEIPNYSYESKDKYKGYSEKLYDLMNNSFNNKDKIGAVKIKMGEGFGSAISNVLKEKGRKYDTNKFHNMTMLYPTLFDDSEGNKGLSNAIQDFAISQKVNILDGDFQLFQNPKGNISMIFKWKKNDEIILKRLIFLK